MLKLIFMASLLESWEMEIMTLSRPMILKQRIRSLECLLNIFTPGLCSRPMMTSEYTGYGPGNLNA